jgi:small subunit ribosomal protein S9
MQVFNATGRRKSAVARVYLQDGKGNITINGKELKDYFPSELLQYVVNQPFQVLNLIGSYDVKANLGGGGTKGQAEALRLGIA